ncbi:MAG: hypothetical protein WDA60_02715 [Acidimicrobiia bacterium]
MTRVVVIGPYPPTADPAGDAVLALVRELRAGGDTVEVVSPVPSAAPHHGDPATWAGASRVARAVRGADRVVWFGAPDEGAVASPLRRALATVPRVEHRPGPTGTREAPTGDRGWTVRLARARAGGPTFVRTVADRVRRLRP